MSIFSFFKRKKKESASIVKKHNGKPFRYDIQALRAIAVLAVVIYHIWPGRLIGGFMGVDIFLVISGYLMTLSIMRDTSTVLTAQRKLRSTGLFLVSFYARRIKRLIPAASVTLIGVMGLTFLTGSYNVIIETSKQVFSSALFFQNWQLVANSTEYMASSDKPTAVQHFWSLSLEEQFYLVWPILLLIFFFASLHVSVMYKRSRISGAILPTILLVLIFFAYGYHQTHTNPDAAYFITFARVWELLIGSVIAFLPTIKNYDLKLLLPWLGAAMCAYAIWSWDISNFPGWHALLPAIGTALIIYGGGGRQESSLSFTNLFKARPLQWTGDISYSLYLWHWPLVVLVPVILHIDTENPDSRPLKIAILLLSFAIAWLSYKFVELPSQAIQLKKRYTYILFVIIVGGVAGVSQVISHSTQDKVDSELSSLHEKVKPGSGNGNSCIGGKWLINKKQCGDGFKISGQRFAQLAPLDDHAKIIDRDVCPSYRHERKDDLKIYCQVGDETSSHRVTVFGDSHARHWVNALDIIGKYNEVNFIVIDSHTCGSLEATKSKCQERLIRLDELGLFDNSNFILVSVLYNYEATRDVATGSAGFPIQALTKVTDTPLYILEDIPQSSKYIGIECTIRAELCVRPINEALGEIKKISHALVSQGIIQPDRIIPTHDMFCDISHCYGISGGVAVYYDVDTSTYNSHLSASYSRSLAEPLADRLRQYDILP